jgi:hypothetical protein
VSTLNEALSAREVKVLFEREMLRWESEQVADEEVRTLRGETYTVAHVPTTADCDCCAHDIDETDYFGEDGLT